MPKTPADTMEAAQVTGVAVQSKKDNEVQLMENQVSYLPESQQEKL